MDIKERIEEARRDALAKTEVEQKKILACIVDAEAKRQQEINAILEKIPELLHDAILKGEISFKLYDIPSDEFNVLTKGTPACLTLNGFAKDLRQAIEHLGYLTAVRYEVKSNRSDPLNHFQEEICELHFLV